MILKEFFNRPAVFTQIIPPTKYREKQDLPKIEKNFVIVTDNVNENFYLDAHFIHKKLAKNKKTSYRP